MIGSKPSALGGHSEQLGMPVGELDDGQLWLSEQRLMQPQRFQPQYRTGQFAVRGRLRQAKIIKAFQRRVMPTLGCDERTLAEFTEFLWIAPELFFIFQQSHGDGFQRCIGHVPPDFRLARHEHKDKQHDKQRQQSGQPRACGPDDFGPAFHAISPAESDIDARWSGKLRLVRWQAKTAGIAMSSSPMAAMDSMVGRASSGGGTLFAPKMEKR